MADAGLECCQKRISDIVWNNHKQRTRKSINVAISPYLIQEGLMGGDRTNEKYTDLLENYKKLDLIVRSVPKCGKDDYLVRFIACLRNSSEEDGGMGSHVELADSMEAEYRSLMERAELSESYRNSLEADGGIVTVSLVSSTTSSLRVDGGYKHVHVTHEGTYLQVNSPKIKAFCKNWCAPFFSAMVWLMFGGIVTALLHFMWPAVGPSHPPYIQCHLSDTISIDLGVDPFWLTSFSTSILSKQVDDHGTLDLYIANASCDKAPTFQKFIRLSSFPPDYLVRGSSMNITNHSGNETLEFWFIRQWPMDCEYTSEWNCDRPPNSSAECARIRPGQTYFYLITYSDYYLFCTRGKQIVSNGKKGDFTYKINSVSYNISAIKELYSPARRISSTSEDITIPEYKLFNFDFREYCIFLDTSVCRTYYRTDQLKVSVVKRKDFLLFPMLAFLVPFTLHITIAAIVIGCRRIRRPIRTYQELEPCT